MSFAKMFTAGGARIPRLFLGCAEAEAEATSERMPLLDVYEDYQNIAESLDNEKFILIGRKGSGKSAFGTYVCEYAKQHAEVFAKFIRKHDFDLELITRSANEASIEFNHASFIKWLVLTHIIKLFLQNEAAKSSGKFTLLDQFLRKNSGYIEIDRANVVEEIKRHQFKVAVEFFRRSLAGERSKSFDIKEERAHYTRLLPHLEETVKEILKSHLVVSNENSFYIFFDDLDLGYTGGAGSKDALVELLRTVRNLNLETFAGTKAKVIVLLRDDIEAQLSEYADTAKLLSSYGHRISWIRERELKAHSENEIRLKKLINKRISHACKVAGVPCRQDDPWLTLVSYQPDNRSKTTFREVLEYTLFRPRDIIEFFAPLSDSEYSIPLRYKEIKKLRSAYGRSLVAELKNEMVARYTKDEIGLIFKTLSSLGVGTSYSDAVKSFALHFDKRADVLLEYLYDRSIIGNVDSKGQYWFSCRSEPGSKGAVIDPNMSIVVQVAVRGHLADQSA